MLKIYLAIEAQALMDLLKKGKVWQWGPIEEEAFERTKSLFIESAFLAYPDPSKPYYLYTDASKNGLRAYLEQGDSDGIFKIILWLVELYMAQN